MIRGKGGHEILKFEYLIFDLVNYFGGPAKIVLIRNKLKIGI